MRARSDRLSIAASVAMVALVVATASGPQARAGDEPPRELLVPVHPTNVRLATPEGRPARLVEAPADRPIVAFFFGRDCPACWPGATHFAKTIVEPCGDRIRAIAVSCDHEVEPAKAFLAKTGLSVPLIFDFFDGEPTRLAEVLDVSTVPSVVVFDPRGEVLLRAHSGAVDAIRGAVDRALAGCVRRLYVPLEDGRTAVLNPVTLEVLSERPREPKEERAGSRAATVRTTAVRIVEGGAIQTVFGPGNAFRPKSLGAAAIAVVDAGDEESVFIALDSGELAVMHVNSQVCNRVALGSAPKGLTLAWVSSE